VAGDAVGAMALITDALDQADRAGVAIVTFEEGQQLPLIVALDWLGLSERMTPALAALHEALEEAFGER
jgi:hypothetical protein